MMGLSTLWCVLVLQLSICMVPFSESTENMQIVAQENFLNSLDDYEVTVPIRVDQHGEEIPYDLINSRKRIARNIKRKMGIHKQLYYKVSAYKKDFHFDLQIQSNFVSDNFQVEYWNNGSLHQKHRTYDSCHYSGILKNHSNSRAVISNCNGLQGIFSTSTEEYIIEPLHNRTAYPKGHPHAIYKRSSIRTEHEDGESVQRCGVEDGTSKWWLDDTSYLLQETKQQTNHTHRRRKRSTSEENFVETLVVVDNKMYLHHTRNNIEPYILTIMNIVANLYHDGSIGNSINIVVSRMIIIIVDQVNLEINHHADKSLDSFCKWQKSINPALDSKAVLEDGIAHHDNAILITRFDICKYQNKPCGTLGLAPVGGMCQSEKSCSISEDMGIATAFTIAHEMGHNFGMEHDGSGNDCGKPGHEKAKIMAAQLSRNTDPFTWSSCSKKYITRFLDSGSGHCLTNPPSVRDITLPTAMSFQVPSADEQCKLQHDEKSRQCKFGSVCKELWCISKTNRCVTNSIPAAEGTECTIGTDERRWCYQGSCEPYGYKPQAVDGEWSQWSSWGQCSRTCGGGVSSLERHCNNPKPSHGGKYCLGDRKRYKSCNIDPCSESSRDYRELQCAEFDNLPFHDKYYTWRPYTGTKVKECALNCLAVGYNFYTERAPQVVDGTLCNKDSLDICINGQCHHVGCDRILGSEVVEDRCRVCGGDGSTCETILGTFTDDLPRGSYQQVITIPKGVVHIEIAEVAVSRNYLALKKSINDDYYINGQWTIDWPRSYDVAGTVFSYERPNEEAEKLSALGPTNEDLIVMLLLQESNLGVSYKYNIPVTRSGSGDDEIRFSWKQHPWSSCSTTCAGGTSTRQLTCVRSDDGSDVPSSHCDQNARPRVSLERECNTEPCPPEWFITEWSPCSRTCGGGFKTRTVACISRSGRNEQETLSDEECFTHKPEFKRNCGEKECPPMWVPDAWGECVPSCGPGEKTRNVECMSSDMQQIFHPQACSSIPRLPTKTPCNSGRCPPPKWETGEWGKCSAECGKGQQVRSVECRAYTGLPSSECHANLMPPQIQECEAPCEPVDKTNDECEDANKVAYCPLVLKFEFCIHSKHAKISKKKKARKKEEKRQKNDHSCQKDVERDDAGFVQNGFPRRNQCQP
ncbi:A disintegrin and metalloproteinase with thrombospondin motifs 6 [Saccoglossus kowalevskii]|uniref:A disintegrin and metalloproteinase with thrombospondin motifs 6 n=1 Tax=Saccoglossus kowalevskii TaxID=10224 RepID=A0ABM0MEW1_SACKO|nr:PREDICTED: A disintegrin and metalloproteinase with thrombospondin motifs 6 [Saccoglossus kowalevskii]